MSLDVKVQLIPDNPDYRSEIIVRHGNEEIANHYDRGEPEDNTFGRDWAWVAPLLRKVYLLGLEDGRLGR